MQGSPKTSDLLFPSRFNWYSSSGRVSNVQWEFFLKWLTEYNPHVKYNVWWKGAATLMSNRSKDYRMQGGNSGTNSESLVWFDLLFDKIPIKCTWRFQRLEVTCKFYGFRQTLHVFFYKKSCLLVVVGVVEFTYLHYVHKSLIQRFSWVLSIFWDIYYWKLVVVDGLEEIAICCKTAL